MTQLELMNELFARIKSMKDEIAVIEKDVRIDFEINVLNFFYDKGFEFEKLKRETYGFPEPFIDYELKNNIQPAFAHDFGVPFKEKKYTYYPPCFRINAGVFTVKFKWWKETNTNWTDVYWHPDQITLEEFYEKKLKRTFKLIK
jgi:hypothetical protein